MRGDLIDGLHEVLLAGLKLRERVARGDRLDVSREQAKLKALLRPGDAPPPWGGGGDPSRSLGNAAVLNREFLGMRYALVCWLDEVLIESGGREWDENKLEMALYRTNIRYSNFWDQARLAESNPAAAEAVAAFLLPALLGFQGELAETPARLKEWVQANRSRVARDHGHEPPAVPEKAPVCNVPALLGPEAYRRMTVRLVAVALFAIPVVAFLLVVGVWK